MKQIVLDQKQIDTTKDPKKAEFGIPSWAKTKVHQREAETETGSWAAIHFRCGDALRGTLRL